MHAIRLLFAVVRDVVMLGAVLATLVVAAILRIE